MDTVIRVVGEGFQRPFELATVRLINMTNILIRWDKITPADKELILQVRAHACVLQVYQASLLRCVCSIMRITGISGQFWTTPGYWILLYGE